MLQMFLLNCKFRAEIGTEDRGGLDPVHSKTN